MIIIFHCNCNGKKKDESKNLELPDFTEKKFDLDSSINIMIPNSWDSIGYLFVPSYEYKYYVNLRSKEKKEGILVERLKFKIPTLKLTELAELYKNEIMTNPSYKKVHLLKDDFPVIDTKNTGILFYSILDKNETVYLSRVFFINTDSSNTLIDVETRNSDTSISYKWNEYIIKSIRINRNKTR